MKDLLLENQQVQNQEENKRVEDLLESLRRFIICKSLNINCIKTIYRSAEDNEPMKKDELGGWQIDGSSKQENCCSNEVTGESQQNDEDPE